MYCEYYQATVLRKKTWFLSAVLRNESNVALARALEGKADTFEFFVPVDQEEHFLRVAKTLLNRGIILSLEKKENRLKACATG
ncbi:hypothetical protein KKA53_02810 [Candidatus Dependentiae bacterium]|nr:hypothetical protein [Candidatus Dependentiae bacterium]